MPKPAHQSAAYAGTSGQADPPASTVRARMNALRRATAHKHLDKMFDDAEGEQIDGRLFYGRIVLELPFEGGAAQDIQASKLARDRVTGGR